MTVQVLCFYQEGCMGCEEQVPINREVEKNLGISIEEIDAVKNPQYVKDYRLKVTPTILVLVDGEVREKKEGLVHREELESAIKKYL